MGAKFGGNVPAVVRFGSGAFWVYLTGIAYILTAISLAIEVQIPLSCGLLGAVVIIIAFSVHLPAMVSATEAMPKLRELINFTKAMAIGGAAWFIAGSYYFGRSAVNHPA